jgi:hypothetical protein
VITCFNSTSIALFRSLSPATLTEACACSSFLLGNLLGMLWPLLKRRRRGGLWAVQVLVPGDSLGDLSLMACLSDTRLRVAWELAPGDRMTPGYLRTLYETMQARLGGLKLGLGLSLLGVMATTAGSLCRYAARLLFKRVRD